MKLNHNVTEKQIETLILKWLNFQPGVMAFKVNTVGIYDTKRGIFRRIVNPFIHKGTSDIIGLCNGTFFCIEVKHPDRLKSVTEEQTRFIDQVKNRGGYGMVATSLQQVENFIYMIRQISPVKNI